MDEKDLVQGTTTNTVNSSHGEKLSWKDELQTSATVEETMDQRVERRLEEMNKKRLEEEYMKNNSQKVLWSNRKIKKFDRERYRNEKCK